MHSPHPVKILVVDDRPSNLIAMQAALKGFDYDIYEALSGKEALSFVALHEFACILLDVQMPFMDGFETALKIRRELHGKSTPIIFVTAIHRTEEYEEIGYEMGAVDYLFKPINTKILQAKVSIFADLFIKSKDLKEKNLLLSQALVQVEEGEKLKAELAAKDDFLSLASHELKTPITPLTLQMQSFIQLFETGMIHKIEPERLLRMLRTSQGQVERLSRLINELVDVSRISSHRLELHKSEVDLSMLVNKVLNDFQEQIQLTGSEIQLQVESNVKGFWDPFRIEQVVINLLTNALKYGEGKVIKIFIFKLDSTTMRFSIHDQGIGINIEDQKRIFQRFERAVSNQNFSGLGLGLYISEQIVSEHKGTISVESAPGFGSTFVVDLPIS